MIYNIEVKIQDLVMNWKISKVPLQRKNYVLWGQKQSSKKSTMKKQLQIVRTS